MLNITNHTLEKLEQLLRDLGYRLRYEKGNFRSGACILHESRVVVVNKFLGLEQRINSLAEIIKSVDADQSELDSKQKSLYLSLRQTEIALPHS
ncbi:MAG TPA: hypothetical protein VD772_01000 [Anseongella sp.]|nr:hypothetical protein [Anseongella sp.]